MVRIGIAGIGFMGVTHYKAAQQITGGRVEAIFTRDPGKLQGDWTNVRGNFGGAGGVQDLSGVRKHDELEKIINDPEIDLLDICLPSYMHREVTLAALKAGKHVLVEKPIALSVEDADAMVAAAQQAGRALMVGQVLRFFPEFAYVKQVMDSGEYGVLAGLHLKRVISRPNWSRDDWFSDPSKTGGPVVDLHIHDTDFVHYLFGMPQQVFASGLVGPEGQVSYLVTQYLYGDQKRCITAASGAVAMSGVMFEHGYDAYFERATLRYNSLPYAATANEAPIPLTVYTQDGQSHVPELPIKDAFVAELQAAVEGAATGTAPASLDGRSARDSLRLVLSEAESARGRRMVSLQ